MHRLGGHWAAAQALWWLEEGSSAHGVHFNQGAVAFQVDLPFFIHIVSVCVSSCHILLLSNIQFKFQFAGASQGGEGELHEEGHSHHAQRPPGLSG